MTSWEVAIVGAGPSGLALANLLGQAGEARGPCGAALLESYEIERRPHVEKMIATSVTVAELAMTTSRSKAAVRNLLFRIAKRVPRVRRHIDGQFFKPKPEVDAGLFVMPAGPRGPVAKMLPQPWLADGRRLDEVLGPGFAVVGLGVTPQLSHRLWRELRVETLRVDIDTFAQVEGPNQMDGLIREHAGKLLLVRPDRYVAGLFDPKDETPFADASGDLIGLFPHLREPSQ